MKPMLFVFLLMAIKLYLADLFRQLIELELPEWTKAIPLNKKDMARCLIGISENFKNNKLEYCL
jgi:hypothetical protein